MAMMSVSFVVLGAFAVAVVAGIIVYFYREGIEAKIRRI